MILKEKFVHDEAIHNLQSPNIIVDHLIALFNPKSVIDFGCGLGTFLYAFKTRSVTNVLGIDGSWVNKQLLRKYLTEDEFLEIDLEKPLNLNRKFDLLITLEVAEHLAEPAADVFVANLTAHANTIVFSAAIPYQIGLNHVNEQWLTYWVAKFAKQGYYAQDIIRPLIWGEKDVSHWYKQNMLVFKKGADSQADVKLPTVINLVHPHLYMDKVIALRNIMNGHHSVASTFKIFVKSVLRKLKLMKPLGKLPNSDTY